jgi:hypothetical protein
MLLNAATLQQHLMIPQEAESDDGHQQIRLSKLARTVYFEQDGDRFCVERPNRP